MKTLSPLLLVLATSLTVLPLACVKTSGSVRTSGQSALMDQTFAGQNACNPEEHTRPFVIEWDATDMSSFESLAAKDLVFVKYEGCKLRVLDECRVEALRGEAGPYNSPEWTSGSLETVDIHNEGELGAKLPLAQGTLGARVAGGEQFHMEYYVSGTVNAITDAVTRGDLTPGCEDATHFVYGYNLGAFALGSLSGVETEAGGSIYGFGAGGNYSKGRAADKKAGDLASCSTDTTGEQPSCKTPIRLNLRKVRD